MVGAEVLKIDWMELINFCSDLSPSERGLHPSVRVEVNFTNFNLVDSEYIV